MIAAFVVAAVFTSATHCNNQPHEPSPYETAGGPVRLPNPNPDHQPTPLGQGPQTPGPIAADPIPEEDKRKIVITVKCSPMADYISIDWTAGPYSNHVSEKRCSTPYVKDQTLVRNMRVTLSANWTEPSYRNLRRIGVRGTIHLTITVNGKVICDITTPNSGNPRSVSCIPFSV